MSTGIQAIRLRVIELGKLSKETFRRLRLGD
jgi:hypothetical protein